MEGVLGSLAAAVVGGLLVHFGAVLRNRAQRGAERHNRWLADRRASYAAFLRHLSEVFDVGELRPATPSSRASHKQAHQELIAEWGHLQLLAPPRIVAFADSMRDWSIDVGITIENELAGRPGGGWDEMQEAYWVLRRDLLDECRADLGLPAANTLEHLIVRASSLSGNAELPIYHPDATWTMSDIKAPTGQESRPPLRRRRHRQQP